MQDSRSQHEVSSGRALPSFQDLLKTARSPPPLSPPQNRDKAYRVLRSRLLDRRLTAEMEERRDVRRNQVKGTDRSEKIRTYNFKDVSPHIPYISPLSTLPFLCARDGKPSPPPARFRG